MTATDRYYGWHGQPEYGQWRRRPDGGIVKRYVTHRWVIIVVHRLATSRERRMDGDVYRFVCERHFAR